MDSNHIYQFINNRKKCFDQAACDYAEEHPDEVTTTPIEEEVCRVTTARPGRRCRARVTTACKGFEGAPLSVYNFTPYCVSCANIIGDEFGFLHDSQAQARLEWLEYLEAIGTATLNELTNCRGIEANRNVFNLMRRAGLVYKNKSDKWRVNLKWRSRIRKNNPKTQIVKSVEKAAKIRAKKLV